MHCCLTERHDELERKLAHQDHLLERIENRMVHMSAALDRLTQEVADTKSAIGNILSLVTSLEATIASTGDDDALAKLADDLAAAKSDILAAITAATPPAPIVADDTASAEGTVQ